MVPKICTGCSLGPVAGKAVPGTIQVFVCEPEGPAATGVFWVLVLLRREARG